MRIAFHIILIAVVSLAAWAKGGQSGSRSVESAENFSNYSSAYSDWFAAHKENLAVLRKQDEPVECCPSVVEMIEPIGGTNQDGMLVHLYSDGSEGKQRVGVEGKPCRFIDRKLHSQSRCVQRYSYTYAIIKVTAEEKRKALSNLTSSQKIPYFSPIGSDWILDYIQVRSGCSCEITAKAKKKRTSHKKRAKSRESEEN